MYEKVHSHVFDESASSLLDNLDVLIEENDDGARNGGYHRMSMLSVHQTKVNLLHCYQGGTSKTFKVSAEKSSQVNRSTILQAKWCRLSNVDLLVICNYEGVLVYDADGNIMMFWHGIQNSGTFDQNLFCRGITCVGGEYLCVGASKGKILIITYKKNTFSVVKTLTDHAAAICSLSGLQDTTGNSKVNFVSADDSGAMRCYKCSGHFDLVSKIPGKGVPVTAVKLMDGGEYIMAGFMSGHIDIFDASSSVLRAHISAHVNTVTAVDAVKKQHADNEFLAISASEDSFLRVWKISLSNHTQVTQLWCASVRDTALCGAKFCDSTGRGQSFVITGYDSKEVMQFSRVS